MFRDRFMINLTWLIKVLFCDDGTILHAHAGGGIKWLQLLENQNLSKVGQFLPEHGSLGPEPLVFGSHAVQVMQDELQPVAQFPVFDPTLVQLVP